MYVRWHDSDPFDMGGASFLMMTVPAKRGVDLCTLGFIMQPYMPELEMPPPTGSQICRVAKMPTEMQDTHAGERLLLEVRLSEMVRKQLPAFSGKPRIW